MRCAADVSGVIVAALEAQWRARTKEAEELPDPKDVDALYEEARRAAGVGSNSCAVLACRKLLMHLAVDKDAEAGKPFAFYVDYLAEKGWVPPNGKAWVNKIKDGGNEENHEIRIADDKTAEDLLFFVQTLLTFMYEVPARLDKSD